MLEHTDAPREWDSLNLTLCDSLETLTISRLMKNPTSEGPPLDPSFLQLLSAAPSTIKTIIIRAYPSTTPHSSFLVPATGGLETLKALREWDWGGIRDEVEKKAKLGLERFVFTTLGEEIAEEAKAVVKEGLGDEIASLDILEFVSSPPEEWR